MADVRTHGPVGAALRALFLPGHDTPRLGDLLRNAVHERDSALVAAAASTRLRVHDHAYELLSARDLVSGSSTALSDAETGARAAAAEVERAAAALSRAAAARAALDATLHIVARTRMLVRVYARAEDMAASRRLHAALRTIGRLDEAAAAARDEDVLRALIPPMEPLREDMAAHVRRAFSAWLAAVRMDTPVVGAYVVAYVRRRAREAAAGGGGAVDGEAVWIPAVCDDERSVKSGGRWSSSNVLHSLQRGSRASGRYGQGVRSPTAGREYPGGESGFGDAAEDEFGLNSASAPRVAMRLILTCVLTCRDLGTLDEFAEDYRRERTKQLEAGLDGILSDQAGTSSSMAGGAERHSRLITFILGFFTVERAVTTYGATSLLSNAMLDTLWSSACDAAVKNGQAVSENSADDAKLVRFNAATLRHFGRVYGFSTSS